MSSPLPYRKETGQIYVLSLRRADDLSRQVYSIDCSDASRETGVRVCDSDFRSGMRRPYIYMDYSNCYTYPGNIFF